MTVPTPDRPSLHALIARHASAGRFIADEKTRIALRDLASHSAVASPAAMFGDRSVLISTRRQLTAALAVAELDGVASRLVICTPDLSAEQRQLAARDAQATVLLTDGAGEKVDGLAHALCTDELSRRSCERPRERSTEWVLFTSGSTGRPKLVLHERCSLLGPLADGPASADQVWSTFYDVRRYGGLQVLLRALAGGGSMVLSAEEPVVCFLVRIARMGVTHLSGTPSHWRRALMSDAAGSIDPSYVRLSGEASDTAILNSLRRRFPRAEIAHAFASTEAGLALTVVDGRPGFPSSLLNRGGDVELRLRDGTLQVRSERTARCYLGHGAPALRSADGFVDTGDLIEVRGARCHFRGRRGGIINVGGLKVHPEEVEAAIGRHSSVRMCRVSARPSPIMGALVVAEIVIDAGVVAASDVDRVKREILALCRETLPAHQIPTFIRRVASLTMASSGKLERKLERLGG